MPSIVLAAHGRITTHHGQQLPNRSFTHRGIDQGHNNMTAYDLQIMAPADGEVTFAGSFGSYGLVLFITHDDGWVSVLAHHKTHLVREGQRVKQRQLVAVMGNTGTVYVHSHQELRNAAGAQVDPLLHLVRVAAAAETLTPVPTASAPASTLLPVFDKGVPTVFKIIRNGWHALVLPADNGLLYAQVLGGKDKTSGIPTVTKLDNLAWASFKDRFVNKDIMPS